ncbi:uncharacterized protein LOC134310640 [Trichomycterus rosablanca]|uniref:uncharacterized protein LOC134310640 n=1 Tax=Trichomycterus rosablanca TaxID=2290929 RepID=UPI002F35A023
MEFACPSVSDLFLSKGGLDQVIGLGGEKLSLYVPSEAIIEPISPAEEVPDESTLTIVTHQAAGEEASGTANTTQLDNLSSDLGVPDEIIETNGLLLDLNPSESLEGSDLKEATGTSVQLLKSSNENGSPEGSKSTTMAPKDAGSSKGDKWARKFIPPKKDRLEPLKIDMSRPPVIPLTSSQLSLQCLECHIIFSDDRSKQRHIKMNHPSEYEQFVLGDSYFTCYVCDQYFTCSTELMAHQRAHTEKQPFKCPICGEAFSRSSELTTHKRVHFSKQQGGYSCLDCGKIFKTLTLLRYHQRKHTGEKPYVCLYKQCSKRFCMRSTLQKHLRAHEIQNTEGPLHFTKKKKIKESLDVGVAAEQEETLILEEAAMVSLEYQEKQVPTVHPDLTETQSNEIHEVHCEVLPELTEKTVPTSPLEANQELLHSTEEQDVVVASNVETLATDNASSLISIPDCENRQTSENEDVSKSADIFDSDNTNTKEHQVVEPQDQNPEVRDSLVEPELQAGQENLDNLDNNPDPIPQSEQLDLIPSEDVKSQISESQSSLSNVHHDQERPPLEEAPSSEAEIQQSTLATEEQDLSGPKDSQNVKRALPMKKKTSKRQAPHKDKAGIKKSQMASAKRNNTSSKASKKQETVKSKKLLVRFGPREKKEKLSKRKLLQISKTSMYKDQHDVVSDRVPALSKKDTQQLKQKKKNQKHEKGKRTKKSGLIKGLNLSSDPKIIKVPEQTLRGKPKKRKLENQKEMLGKVRKPAQETQQDESPLPKKKKPTKTPDTPPKKKTKANEAESKAKKKSQKLEKQTEKDQNVSLPSTMDQIKQAALLLLKGHKQPQLKVHKLDAKTTGLDQQLTHKFQTKEATNQLTTVVPAAKGTQNKSPKTTSQKKGKSIGKKSRKVQNESQKPSVDDLTSKSFGEKQKIVRKRKAWTKIDQEIALSPPYSRVVIGCHDCGKHFSEVSALQEHMASIHCQSGVSHLSFTSNDTIPVNTVHSRSFETRVSSDWEVDPELREIGLDDRGEHRPSFPALCPSPSFPMTANPVEGQAKEDDHICQETPLEHSEALGENAREVTSTEVATCHDDTVGKNARELEITEIQSVSESQENMDFKEELPLDVNLVMVEEQNEVDIHVSTQANNSQEASDEQEDEPNSSQVNHIPAQDQSPAKTVNSASTQYSDSHLLEQPEVKQEEGEIVIQKVRNQVVARGRRGRGGRGRGKRRPAENRVMKEMVSNDEDCSVVYELYSLTDNHDATTENVNKKRKSNDATAASVQPALEESDGSQIQKPGEEDENSGSCRQEENTVHHQPEIMRKNDSPHPANEVVNLDGTSADVKLEASSLAPAPNDDQPAERGVLQGVHVILVKAEDHHILDDVSVFQENQQLQMSASHLEESLDHPTSRIPSDASPVPQPVGKQCIFYPVKEEQGEMLVEPSLDEQGILAGLEDCEAIRVGCTQMEMQPNVSSSAVEGSVGTEQQSTEDFLEFLSQASDTEDSDNFQSEPEAEALIMSCYRGIHTNERGCQPEKSGLERHGRNSNSVDSSPSDHQGDGSREPPKHIDYFTQYFGLNTWKEIAACTKQVSKLPVTAKEVAQFVGIHIAMGTLKFPSIKLYWEDYTRVPLIADAMSTSRFSELVSRLRLANSKDSPIRDDHSNGRNTDQMDPEGEALRHGPEDLSVNNSTTCRIQGAENCTAPDPDPLWKVQAIIKRVQERCRVLKRNGNHGVDQYRLPFERHPTHSLDHTVMVSAAGQVMDYSLQVNDSNREEVVEKMVSQEEGDNLDKGMVFLCKPELSTPSMLEHLLKSGVRSAGKVGGSRGQIGDEFVTSDGKLKLFRCHHGFILSAVTKEKSRSTSLVSGFERAIKAANLNRDLRSLYRTPCTNPSPGAWPQSVLWELVDLALVNSWLEYKQDQNHLSEPLSLMAFRLEVSKGLILASSIDTQGFSPPYPPSPMRSDSATSVGISDAFDTPLPDVATRYDGLGHWPEQLSEGEEARCRFGGCERTSRVRCLKCCVFLCISRNHNCFLKFHSHGSE